LRQPVARFLGQVASRASKLSVFKVEIELGDVAPLQAMSLPSLDDIQTPEATAWSIDSTGDLFKQIQDARMADYAVIDLGDGKQWLTSRIFIFAVMLERMRGLRQIVFLHSYNGKRRIFLGIARPTKIHWLIGQKYPWLEKIFADAYSLYWASFPYPPTPFYPATPDPKLLLSENGALDPLHAATLVRTFLQGIQMRFPSTPPLGSTEWAQLRPEWWEHASWVDKILLTELLETNLIRPTIEYSLDIPSLEQTKTVLRRSGEFVAVVDKEGAFVNVVNRQALVEKLATMAGKLEP
jgi:hypothetical protein